MRKADFPFLIGSEADLAAQLKILDLERRKKDCAVFLELKYRC